MDPIMTDIIDLRVIDGLDWHSLYSEIKSLETVVLKRMRGKKKMLEEINFELSEFLEDLKSVLSETEIYDKCFFDERSSVGHSVDMDWRTFDNMICGAMIDKIGIIRTVSLDDEDFRVDMRGILDETFEIVYENMRPGMMKFLSIPDHFDPPYEDASDHEWLEYRQGLRYERLSSLVQALDFTDSLARRAGILAQRYVIGEISSVETNPYSHLLDLLKKGIITDWTLQNIPQYTKFNRLESNIFVESKRGPRIVKLKHNDNSFSEEIIKYPEL